MADAHAAGESPEEEPAGGGLFLPRGAIFANREDAGRQLAAKLEKYKGANGVVLALPRGGVPVGYQVARALRLPLDLYVVRKLGAPDQPELGVGAIAPGGVIILDNNAIAALGITREQIEEVIGAERAEMERRTLAFRGALPPPDVHGKTVILVDDGLATGVTASAAIIALRKQEPARIVLAVPVCASATVAALRAQVDDLICVETPQHFAAVGLWYANFEQTTDEEVVDLLERSQPSRQGRTVTQGAQESSSLKWTLTASEGATPVQRAVQVPVGDISIDGDLTIPSSASAVVLFAHGSGSSRFSSRNRAVARELQNAGFATLLIDLLTAEEEIAEAQTRHLRFDISLLAERLVYAMSWLRSEESTAALPIGLFGASTGAAAALVAAAARPDDVKAIVSRGGRPDLAGKHLSQVAAPTLLIVGGEDTQVIELNKQAFAELPAVKEMAIVPGATHLFEELGALEQVSRLAVEWFSRFVVV
ncbi:MAG: dienelactone hydrolase family protein [Chloroflexi bacterium]|nr:dienelactone hydrolase family protein [Chloroflexota bacterium]